MKNVTFTIYQLNDSEESKAKLGLVWDKVKQSFDAGLYNKVWSDAYDLTDEEAKTEITALNAIVGKLNKDLPRGFYGHMVTISDIIMADDVLWYVDEIGYKKIDCDTNMFD